MANVSPRIDEVGAHLGEVLEGENAREGRWLRTENARLADDNARLQARIDELERFADTDPLIDVYNRRAFMREISRAQTVSGRYHIPSCVVFLDLNDFKSVNDRFGHAMGDDLLRAIGECLVEGVRDCDLVARLGGDEFGVLLFKTTPEVARAKAAALQMRIQGCRIAGPGTTIRTDAAWGVAPCEPGVGPEAVLARADRAMFGRK